MSDAPTTMTRDDRSARGPAAPIALLAAGLVVLGAGPGAGMLAARSAGASSPASVTSAFSAGALPAEAVLGRAEAVAFAATVPTARASHIALTRRAMLDR